MNTFRNNIKCNFSIIPNSVIQDDKLSDRARFLFCYMATKPDDWQFYQKPLAKALGYSLETLRKYIDELLESGWLMREPRRGERGRRTWGRTFGPVRPNSAQQNKRRRNPAKKQPKNLRRRFGAIRRSKTSRPCFDDEHPLVYNLSRVRVGAHSSRLFYGG